MWWVKQLVNKYTTFFLADSKFTYFSLNVGKIPSLQLVYINVKVEMVFFVNFNSDGLMLEINYNFLSSWQGQE